MNIIFFGDTFGKAGRNAIKNFLPKFKKEHDIDIAIANCENITNGRGASERKIKEMIECGIDLFSSGNHLWDQRKELEFIANSEHIAKPLNYPKQAIGKEYVTKNIRDTQLVLITLCGQAHMNTPYPPLHTLEEFIDNMEQDTQKKTIIIVDIHAESTAEKRILAHYFDGKVSAILGTHTHIQTADEEILPNGTAYITDVGMCGSHDSVIGVTKEVAIEKNINGMPIRHIPAETGLQVNAVYVEIDENTAKATKIQRIREKI